MALLVMEGFEGFGTSLTANITTLLNEKWGGHGSGPYYLDVGRSGGYCIRTSSTGQDQWISLGCGATPANFILGCGFKAVAATPDVVLFYFYGNPGATYLASLTWLSATGQLKYTNSAGTAWTTTGANLGNGSGWHFVEVKVVMGSGTSGSVQIKVDGVTKLNQTGVNTTNAQGSTFLTVVNLNATSQYRVDDIYICDSTGSRNNDFLGDHVVIGKGPSADTAQKDWTPSSGATHCNLVNETASDDDGSYVSDATSGHLDLYDYDDLTGVASIAGVMMLTTCKLTDATSFSLKSAIKSGATTSLDPGTVAPPSTGYGSVGRISETNPDGGAAWTQTTLNAAEFGFQVA